MKNSTLFEAAYFETLVNAYKVGDGMFGGCIQPPIPLEGGAPDELPSPQRYLLPSVILWDPATQLSCFKNGIPCPHESHHSEKFLLQIQNKGVHFKTGKDGKELPRPLYGSDGVTFLISRVYSCKSGHKIIAHDARILDMIPDSSEIPFMLFHRMGVTRELASLAKMFVFCGMSFSEIHEVVTQRYLDKYTLRKTTYERDVKADSDGAEAFPEFNTSVLPSMETMMTPLVEDFQEFKPYYDQRMSEWSAKCITAGHLFKVRTTIGEKTAENKWVTHYDALYTVVNEIGQVIAWQLTNKKSLDDVTNLLAGLQERLEKRDQHLDLALVPDCCDAREKFTAIFGVDVPVKLDPGKAIHMVMRKIPEKKRTNNPLTKSCGHDFSKVFRRSADHGDDRCEETPPPEEILSNINEFLRLYKHMTEETGERVFPLSASRQVDLLKQHVEEGCLSGIPPGCGSEKTTELQSILQPVLQKKFLSKDVAVPLLTTLFYVWNERKADQTPKGTSVQPITSYKASLEGSEYEQTTEIFGTTNLDSTVPMEGDYTFDVRALRVLIAEALGETKEIQADGVSDGEMGRKLTDAMLKKSVITKAENYLAIQNRLTAMRRNPNFPARLMHLLPCAVLLFSRHECIVGSSPSHDETLDKTLDLYNLGIFDQVGMDGFFEAVASGLNQLVAGGGTESELLKAHLESIGYKAGGDLIQEDVLALRQIISKEWLANYEDYHKLLVSPLLDFKEEAQNFSQCGYYKAEMANLLPLSAAKVLQVPIVLFTSLEHFPVVPIVPTDVITTKMPILVAYSALECGTFYSIKTLDDRGTSTKEDTQMAGGNISSGVDGGKASALSEKMQSGIPGGGNKSTGDGNHANETNLVGASDGVTAAKEDTQMAGSNLEGGKESALSETMPTGVPAGADKSTAVDNLANDGGTNPTAAKEDTQMAGGNISTGVDGGKASALPETMPSGVPAGGNLANDGGTHLVGMPGGVNSTEDMQITAQGGGIPEQMAPDSSMAGRDGTSIKVEDSGTVAEASVLDGSGGPVPDAEMNDPTNAGDGTVEGQNGTKTDGGSGGLDSAPGSMQSSADAGQDDSADAIRRMREAARKRKWRRSKQCMIKQDKSKPIACGCGRGAGQKAKGRTFCIQTDPDQRMRCDCYREGVGCSYHCRCVRCANPFGTCDEAKAKCPRTRPATTKRLRPKYKIQAIKSHVSTYRPKARPSAWLESESLAFEHLLDLMAYTGVEPSKGNISAAYENLLRVANEEGSNCVTSKTTAELSQQLDVVQKSMQTFENLYKKQTELNWFQGITEVCCMEVETS